MPQQNLLNFLQQPPPGKAAPTQVLPTPQNKFQLARSREARLQQQLAFRQQRAQQAPLERQQAAIQRQLEQTARAEQSDRRRFEREATEAGAQTLSSVAANVGDSVSQVAERVTGWAEQVPTPGGIGLLLVLIFLLLWAVVPVNGGKTRLQLLWMTLTGRTKMAASPDAGGTYDASSTGSGVNIGSGGTNGHESAATADLLATLGIRDWSSQ